MSAEARRRALLAAPVAAGMIRLVPSRGPVLMAILAGPPERSGGVGGWQTVERMGRRPAKWWQAPPDDAMTLELILDKHVPHGSGVPHRLRSLRLMGTAGTEDEPPYLRLRGDLDPGDQAIRWVLQDLTLGDRLYGQDGVLRRQHVTLELEGYRPVPTIRPIRIHSTRDRSGHRRRRVYRTRKGDTLRKIAVAQLGSSGQWKQIRAWNPKVTGDPDKQLPANTRLVLR